MVTGVTGLLGQTVISRVIMEPGQGPDCAITHHQPMEAKPATVQQPTPSPVIWTNVQVSIILISETTELRHYPNTRRQMTKHSFENLTSYYLASKENEGKLIGSLKYRKIPLIYGKCSSTLFKLKIKILILKPKKALIIHLLSQRCLCRILILVVRKPSYCLVYVKEKLQWN